MRTNILARISWHLETTMSDKVLESTKADSSSGGQRTTGVGLYYFEE